MSYLGRNIRTYRQVRGLTIKQLATLCNSSSSGISQIETGKRDATFKMILAIAQALEVDITELVTPPDKIKYIHHLDIVFQMQDYQLVSGNSISSIGEVVGWSLIVDLSEGVLIEEIYFNTNNESLTLDDFYENKLKPYLLEQRLRILIRNDVDLNVSLEEIKSKGISWYNMFITIQHFQEVLFKKLLSNPMSVQEETTDDDKV